MKTEAQVVATAFNDLYKRNQLAVARLSDVVMHDPSTPPTLKLALTLIRDNLLAPSETALLFGEMSKSERPLPSLDIIANAQKENYR